MGKRGQTASTAKPAAKPTGRPKAQALPSESAVASLVPDRGHGINAEVMKTHVGNVEIVMHCPVFTDVASADPIQINTAELDGESGYQDVWDAVKGMSALKNRRKYLASFNVAWLDALWMNPAMRNVPIEWETVLSVKRYHFKTPTGFMEVLLSCITSLT